MTKPDEWNQLLGRLQQVEIETDPLQLAEIAWLSLLLQASEPSRAAASPSDEAKTTSPSGPGTVPSDLSQKTGVAETPAAPSVDRENDPLLYANETAPAGKVPASRIRVPGVPALPEAEEINRALRPLLRRNRSRRFTEIDEQATVSLSADAGCTLPVFRGLPERAYDAALVVEKKPSMAIWRETIREFRLLLERHGAFGDVRRFDLAIPENETIQAQLISISGAELSLASLNDPLGKRIVFLITDGVSDSWTKGRMARLTQDWIERMPVVVVQMLSPHLWRLTPIGRPKAKAVASRPGAPNASLTVIPSTRLEDIQQRLRRKELLPLPVVTLDPRRLAPWASMLAAGSSPVETYLLELLTEKSEDSTQESRIDSAPTQKEAQLYTAEELVERFEDLVSPTAFRLAGYFSLAPLHLPIMLMIQRLMLPESRIEHLSEFLLGGIVRRAEAFELPLESGEVGFEFLDENIPDLLIEPQVRESERMRVFDALSKYIESEYGLTYDFKALLANNTGDLKVSKIIQPFARIASKTAAKYKIMNNAIQYHNIASSSLSDEKWSDSTLGPIPIKAIDKSFPTQITELDIAKANNLGNLTPPSSTPPVANKLINIPSFNANDAFFIGRDFILERLYKRFSSGELLQAIIGAGGTGKSQIAARYAHHYQAHYQVILWAKANSQGSLIHDYAEIAETLKIPVRDTQDKNAVAKDLLNWLERQNDVLIVFDDVEDIELVRSYIPHSDSIHTLITSRLEHTATMAAPILLDGFEPEEGALFILRRLLILDESAELDAASIDLRAQAIQLSTILDGIPLALSLATAYIERNQLTIADYIELYGSEPYEVLEDKERSANDKPPKSVAVTFSLSFKTLKVENPAAADILHLCAFLNPDHIPEEIFQKGRDDLGTPLSEIVVSPREFTEAIGVNVLYSFFKRDRQAKTNSIHRLVQTLIYDEMSDVEQRLWAERAIRSMNSSFPQVEYQSFSYCERLIQHVQTLFTVIDRFDFTLPEAARLLSRAGSYLKERGLFEPAEKLLNLSLQISNATADARSDDTFQTQLDMADLYRQIGDYSEAERLYQKCKMIREQAFGFTHPDVAKTLSRLAAVYTDQARYDEADLLLGNCLAIYQSAGLEESLEYAKALSNRGELYRTLGKYEEAERIYKTSLVIIERVSGPDHPDRAILLSILADLYRKQEHYPEAISLFHHSLKILEKVFGDKHLKTADARFNLADAYREIGNFTEAETLYRGAIDVYLEALGEASPILAVAYNNLALLYTTTANWELAERFFRQALMINEMRDTVSHPDYAAVLNNLADNCHTAGKLEEAAFFYQKSLGIYERVFGSKHPDFILVRENYELLKAEMESLGKNEVA